MSATATIVRTGNSNLNVSVTFLTQDGSAFSGVNYVGTNVSIPFGIGQVSASAVVTLIHDGIADVDRTVNLYLTNAVVALLDTYTNAVLTIRDTDPTFTFASTPYLFNEALGTATLTINRAGALSSRWT